MIGNWKMHGNLSWNESLLSELKRAADPVGELGVCVPFPYLAQVQKLLSGTSIAWGAQDVSEYHSGAYTGQVSAEMLQEFGCRYVIVGHSERRHGLGETDLMIARKCKQVLEHRMIPILCVGETLSERQSGMTNQIVLRQLQAVLDTVGEMTQKLVIAYEPVWAIGTGQTATPAQAQEVHALIRTRLRTASAATVPLLYGGSVKPDNAAQLFAQPDIDGGLIGGASLKAEDFLAIANYS